MDIEIKKEDDITDYACDENLTDGTCDIFYILCKLQSLVSREALIIGIGRLSAVLRIIGIGRLLRWYRSIVVYTTGTVTTSLYHADTV